MRMFEKIDNWVAKKCEKAELKKMKFASPDKSNFH